MSEELVMLDIIFVFGSNLAGRHGKGAARHAAYKYGAKRGVGEGRTGNAYAIPTKTANLRRRKYDAVLNSIKRFNNYAWNSYISKNNELFMVTPIGTGLAGFTISEIGGMFQEFEWPETVLFTADWVKKTCFYV